MPNSAEAVAREIVHAFDCQAKYGMCDSQEPCAKCRRLRKRIADALTRYAAEQVQAMWEEAATVCGEWEDNRKTFALTNPADFGAKVMAANLADEFRRRAQEEKG